MTLRDSLTWDGGGVIRLVLGADSAGSDHLSVGSLIRGTDGLFVFDLIDAGITAGTEYDLLSFDEQVAFSASDFEVRGRTGSFVLATNGMLGFTPAPMVSDVPAPSTCALLLVGLGAVWRTRRRWQPAAPATFLV